MTLEASCSASSAPEGVGAHGTEPLCLALKAFLRLSDAARRLQARQPPFPPDRAPCVAGLRSRVLCLCDCLCSLVALWWLVDRNHSLWPKITHARVPHLRRRARGHRLGAFDHRIAPRRPRLLLPGLPLAGRPLVCCWARARVSRRPPPACAPGFASGLGPPTVQAAPPWAWARACMPAGTSRASPAHASCASASLTRPNSSTATCGAWSSARCLRSCGASSSRSPSSECVPSHRLVARAFRDRLWLSLEPLAATAHCHCSPLLVSPCIAATFATTRL